jgi:hypothetical protein
MSLIYIAPSYFFKLSFRGLKVLQAVSFLLVFSPKPAFFSPFLIRITTPSYVILLDLIIQVTFCEEYG